MRRKLLPFVKHLLITGGHGDEHEIQTACTAATASAHLHLPAPAGQLSRFGLHLASALAGRLARAKTWPAPYETALNYTWRTLRDAEQLGKGQFVPRRLPLDFCS
jgi:hydroxymethylpyrimidine/phosphomethylpyrimidine kinase